MTMHNVPTGRHIPRRLFPTNYRSVYVIRKQHVRPWLVNTGKRSNCYVTTSDGTIKQYKSKAACEYDAEYLSRYYGVDCSLIVTEWRIPTRG